MTVLPPHIKPTTKQDYLDTLRSSGRIDVPTKAGRIMGLILERIYETTAVDGLPLDLLIEARATKQAEIKKFGVVFANERPVDDYPIAVLWVLDGESSWLL